MKQIKSFQLKTTIKINTTMIEKKG